MTDAGDIARMRRIVDRVRARGVRVIFVAGWDQRGDTFPVVPNASFIHHDASSTSSGTWGALGIITNGRSDLPPPLAQFQVARGDTAQLAVVAAGIANHAGLGGPHKGLPLNNANRETYGMEVANNGVGERYSSATITAIRVLQASIAEECGFGAFYVIGHKEWTSRKIDPTYDMDWMRGLVRTTMQEEDDMQPDERQALFALLELAKDINRDTNELDARLSEYPTLADIINEVKKLTPLTVKDIWHTDGIVDNPYQNAGNLKWTAENAIEHLIRRAIAQEAAIDKLADAVASGDPVTAEELKNAIHDAFSEAFGGGSGT